MPVWLLWVAFPDISLLVESDNQIPAVLEFQHSLLNIKLLCALVSLIPMALLGKP